MKYEDENIVSNINDVNDQTMYRVSDLQAILKRMKLNHSIFTIRDYETYKCLNYNCGKRHLHPVTICERCGGSVRAPLIPSPRTRGGGKGMGHRRYTGLEIKEIVSIFRERL